MVDTSLWQDHTCQGGTARSCKELLAVSPLALLRMCGPGLERSTLLLSSLSSWEVRRMPDLIYGIMASS